MELAINRESMKVKDFLCTKCRELMEACARVKCEGLTDAAEEIEEEEEEPVCEHFAFKRTLLFYTETCACCRYARCVRDAEGKKIYVCGCASCGKSAC